MNPTPYRLVIFASGFRPKRRRNTYTEIELCRFAYFGWTLTQHYQEARLPSAGSFLFPGIHAVRAAAMEALSQSGVEQVSIRTNQDKQVYRFFKHQDGTISGYGGE